MEINKYNYKPLLNKLFDSYTLGKITKETYVKKINNVTATAEKKVLQSKQLYDSVEDIRKEIHLNREQFIELA